MLRIRNDMAKKLKLRKGTMYPFKHLDKIGKVFSVEGKKKNIAASLAMYKKNNPLFEAIITEYEDGTICVTRTA